MIQLVWILIAAALGVLAWSFRDALPYIVGGAAVLIVGGWAVISTLWPSRPNRRCPSCGEEGLVKIQRGKPGVRCERCDFRDESMHVAYLDDW